MTVSGKPGLGEGHFHPLASGRALGLLEPSVCQQVQRDHLGQRVLGGSVSPCVLNLACLYLDEVVRPKSACWGFDVSESHRGSLRAPRSETLKTPPAPGPCRHGGGCLVTRGLHSDQVTDPYC